MSLKSTRIQRRPLLTTGLRITEVRPFFCSFCLPLQFKVALFAYCKVFFPLGLMSVSYRDSLYTDVVL